MAIRVGINGFGRIGRNIIRAALDDNDIEFVAVNDMTDARTLAHLLKYDSVLGNLDRAIDVNQRFDLGRWRRRSRFSRSRTRRNSGQDLGAHVVFESTGKFTDVDDAAKHLTAGERK